MRPWFATDAFSKGGEIENGERGVKNITYLLYVAFVWRVAAVHKLDSVTFSWFIFF
jgi:hypothetical protein